MRILGAILLSGCLAACTTSSQTVLPDGSRGQIISCGGNMNSMGGCYQKAGDLCPAGYDILDANGEAHPFSAGGGSISATPNNVTGGYTQYSGMFVHRTLMVRCKS